MSAPLFRLELFGGPADGFKVEMPQFPERTVRMPASPTAASCDDDQSQRSCDQFVAFYDIVRQQCDFDHEARPVIRLRYEFVGMHPCGEPVSTRRTSWRRRLGLAWLQDLLAIAR